MDQLFMERLGLSELPEMPPMPEGYTLRTATDGDAEALARLIRETFEMEDCDVAWVNRVLLHAPDVRQTYLIEHSGIPVATASVQFKEVDESIGTVHYVAAASDHKGKRLGYLVSLAVLRDFRERGCAGVNLTTDDFRLPAIKTYLNLGFLPKHRGESHAERWEAVNARLTGGASG